jgi:hypothetical protein
MNKDAKYLVINNDGDVYWFNEEPSDEDKQYVDEGELCAIVKLEDLTYWFEGEWHKIKEDKHEEE